MKAAVVGFQLSRLPSRLRRPVPGSPTLGVGPGISSVPVETLNSETHLAEAEAVSVVKGWNAAAPGVVAQKQPELEVGSVGWKMESALSHSTPTSLKGKQSSCLPLLAGQQTCAAPADDHVALVLHLQQQLALCAWPIQPARRGGANLRHKAFKTNKADICSFSSFNLSA